MFIFSLEVFEPFTLSRQMPTKVDPGGDKQTGFTFPGVLKVAGTNISVPVTFRAMTCTCDQARRTKKWSAQFVSSEEDPRLEVELKPLDNRVKVNYVGINIGQPAPGSKRIPVYLLPVQAPQERAAVRKPARQRLRASQEAARAAV